MSKEASDYVKENKLDTLTIVGITDFTHSPFASYLDRKIYYPQMHDSGSFTIWSKQRIDQLPFQQLVESVTGMIKQGRSKLLLIKDSAPQISLDGKNYITLEHAMLAPDIQIDLLKSFEPGIVSDEVYYIYLVKKVDPSKVDPEKYFLVQ